MRGLIYLEETLLADGLVGISMLSRQLLGKMPLLMSLSVALISGKQASAASLKSVSLLSSFFLIRNNQTPRGKF